MAEKITNIRYNTIEELIAEVEALGDWKDPSQKEAYFIILAKLAVLYEGYKIDGERNFYPSEVMKAVCMVCSQKFPSQDIAYDENGKLKPGCPGYTNYLCLAAEPLLVSLMCERTDIPGRAKEYFGIRIYDVPATQEQVDSLVESCRRYLEKVKESQPQPQ